MKRTLLMVLTSGCVLSGCSMLSQENQTDAPSNAELQAQLDQQQQEWQAMKPQLQRILALESDLKLLVEALDTVPESSEEITQELAPKGSKGTAGTTADIKPSAAMAEMDADSSSSSQVDSAAKSRNQVAEEDAGKAQFYRPKTPGSAPQSKPTSATEQGVA